MPEPTSAPVTAEDLRERIAEALAPWCRVHEITEAPCERCALRLDAVMAALAGDPGDLPGRMLTAMRQHRLDERSDDPPGLTICVCGEQVIDFKTHLARVAMSVRWEAAARQAAEVKQLRAELAEAKKAVVNAQGSERYMEKSLRNQDNRVRGLRQEIDRLRQGRDEAGVYVGQVEAERDLLRETLAESDLGAQVLAQWEAIAAADADRDRLAGELAEMTDLRDKLSATVHAFPDARDAANIAHARAQRDAAQAEVQRIRSHLANWRKAADDVGAVVHQRAKTAEAELVTLRGFFDAMTDQRDALKAATAKIHEAAKRLQEADSPGVSAFWSHELMKLTLALSVPESNEDAEDGAWRRDEKEIAGGFTGNEFPRLWPPRRAPETPGDAEEAKGRE